MAFPHDPRVAAAEARPIAEIADRLGIKGLSRVGQELVGPCPVCGGTDRFAIAPRQGVFNCRICAVGGGGIKLVMHTLACDFPAALDWLEGGREVRLSDEEIARREVVARKERDRREQEAERHRERAIASARAIWHEGLPPERSPVREYLALRGCGVDRLPQIPDSIRFHARLPYMVADGRDWVEVHRGPAMIAAITGRNGEFTGLHRTWIDLDQPKGKARIQHRGTAQKAKKTLGSKKGGAVRLVSPPGATVMVVGEGIETTLSAAVSGDPGWAYWAGIDLGNMAGRRIGGKGMKFSGIPDMSDLDAFLPPETVEHLVFIRDGDSDPRTTRAQLLSGLRRAMMTRPGLRAQIVDAGDGRDLNDVLVGGA